MKKHWPDCEINNGGKCDCNRKYMTNRPPTIKRMEEEFNKKVGDVEKFRKLGRLRSGASGELAYENFYYEIKSFFSSYLSEVLEYLQGEVKNVAGKKFPLGERKWCVECAQRIRKELNNKIKKLKGEG